MKPQKDNTPWKGLAILLFVFCISFLLSAIGLYREDLGKIKEQYQQGYINGTQDGYKEGYVNGSVNTIQQVNDLILTDLTIKGYSEIVISYMNREIDLKCEVQR